MMCYLAHAALGGILALATAAEDKGVVVTIDGLSSRTPAAWKAVDVEGRFGRFKQFTLPRVEGDERDAELIIYFFGTGGGGPVDANIERWRGMFEPPEGKKLEDVSKVSELNIGDVKATYLDVAGTYLFKPFPMARRAEPRPDHRMVAVYFDSPKGPYFMRFVGPAKTVSHYKEGFDHWLKGFKQQP